MNQNSKHTAELGRSGVEITPSEIFTIHEHMLRRPKLDQAVEALKFVVAVLTQPVQFTANIGKPDCNRCDLLRSDAAAAVKQARTTLATIVHVESEQANATLIASAPDLLRQRDELAVALQDMLDYTTTKIDSHRLHELGQIENQARIIINRMESEGK